MNHLFSAFPRAWIWPLLVAALIFAASARSQVAAPGFASSDKVGHFLVYGLLATLLVRIGRGPRTWIWALLATSFYGISDECHQYFVPGRSSEVADWVADSLGGALAIALYCGWPWYRAMLESELRPKRRVENRPAVATVTSA